MTSKPLPMSERVNHLAETKQENDLIRSLRQRNNRERLILSDSEFAQCLVIARRNPHWRDRPDENLRGIIIGNLI
jgi:hypothetical protein